MKRLLSLLLTTTLLALLLCSCHGENSKDAFAIPEYVDLTKEYNISFWAKNDNNQRQAEIYKQAIKNFEAIYPNIHVTMKTYMDYPSLYRDVITNISTDTTPNVCITYPDHIATYMQGTNIVVKLDDLLHDPHYGLGGSEIRFDGPTQNEIVAKFLEECRIGDGQYALPFMRSTEALYINKTVLEATGYTLPDKITWDYIWEVSEAALAKNADGTYKANGQTTLIPFIYKSTDNMMISMLRQKNIDYTDAYGNLLLFNDGTAEILKVIAEHGKSRAFSTFGISSYPGNYLNANQCIFAVDSTAGATWMGKDAPNLDIHSEDVADFEIVVTEIPQFDTANPKMISQGPSLCLFNKSDRGEVVASWIFLQYLLTNEVQNAYSQTEGYIPVTTKAHESAEYQEYLAGEGTDNDLHYSVKIQAAKLLLKNIDNSFVTPVFAGSASVREAAGELIENVTKSGRRRITVDDAYIRQLYSDVSALKHLDQITPVDPSADAGDAKASAKVTSKDLGKLPGASLALLIALPVVWVGLVVIMLLEKKKRQKTAGKA
ncbi:MAG: extracellular solute-binding protein [Lachnospiraceae bacterium]|nr:extracellular solute-binding protein [Lachnospiraceae bacterium]